VERSILKQRKPRGSFLRANDYDGGGDKVKISLCLTKHNAMKTYWEVEA